MKISVPLLLLLVLTVVIAEAKKGGKGRKKDKDRKDCKGRKCKDKGRGKGRSGDVEYVAPLSGMRVRLGGEEKNSSSGNVEVFLRNRWGMVCDDEWGINDAHVVCRQLGFLGGAVSETRESYFGEVNWNSTDILMDDVNCVGNEGSLQQCNYVYPSNCGPSEGAGVVCQPNIGCPSNWIAGPDSCYLMPNITTTQRQFAVNRCKDLGGHLVTIESEAENHFLTMLFSDFQGEGILTGGLKTSDGWMWEKVTIGSSSFDFPDFDDLFRFRRSPRRQRSGPGRSPRRRRPGSRRPKGGKSGGSSGRSSVETIVESTTSISIDYFKWFPGWMPGGEKAEPTNTWNDKCIYLKNQFQHPDTKQLTNVGYLFWDDEICRRTRKKFKDGLHYLCEMPRQAVAMPTTSEPPFVQADSCYVDNGVTYRGTVARTDKGTPCIPWAQSGRHTPEDFPDSGLAGHNYCRNPDGDVRPWCYVDGEGTFNFCPIPRCSQTSHTTPAMQSTSTTAQPELECPGDQFYCRNSSQCISQQWRCDAEPDCNPSDDELNCDYKINLFRKVPGRMLQNHVTKETFVGVSNETCAKFCLSRTQYVCRSFSFKQQTRHCILSDTNIQMSGLPAEGEGYNYFELTSQTVDCAAEGIFTCGNGRCIDSSLVCNGEDNCNDLTDERECGHSQPINIRLAGGGEHSGRVEIQYLGEWGVICDDNWDINDATVVCRMLGINSGIAKAVGSSKYGSGNGLFLLDEVNCDGTESSLEDCQHPPWKEHNCRSYEVAGVECGADKSCDDNQYTCPDGSCLPAKHVCDGTCHCTPSCEDENGSGEFDCQSGTLELVNGTQPNSGRVELIRNGLRGTVCDDDWDNKDATVVCRMFGLGYGTAVTKGEFGKGSGPIWLDSVECSGTEASLSNCEHATWGINDCTHIEDAGVICSDGPPTDEILVELVDGQNSMEGRVEIVRNGVRGTVCDDEWSDEDARVVCRMLGHSGGVAKQGGSFGPGSDTLDILLDDVSCTGTEKSLKECTHAGWGTHDCAHGEDAGVVCGTDGGGDGTDGDTEISGFGVCGRRPLEESNERFKREDPFELREVEDVPKFERIIGGFTATKGFYPWQAGIRRLVQYPDLYSHYCGGTILSEYWILTAAHCYVDVLKDHIRVRAGDHDNKVDDDYEEEFEVEQLISHVAYDEDTFDNDIALIKIKPNDGHGVRFSDHVQPACLPDVNTVYETGKKCHVSGWGKTEHGYQNFLKSARVPLLADRTCESLYKDFTVNMFCAGYLEGGIDTCSGDSGGPLVCEINGVYTVLGATSYGAGCAEANAPGVYTRISQYLSWIKNVINRYS